MPIYNGRNVQGECERFGLTCQRPDHFTATAKEYGAKARAYSNKIDMGTHTAKIRYWGLSVPKTKTKKASMMIGRNGIGTVTEDGELVNPRFLEVLPCLAGCDYYNNHLALAVLPAIEDENEQI
jgi:hypothetical protein